MALPDSNVLGNPSTTTVTFQTSIEDLRDYVAGLSFSHISGTASSTQVPFLDSLRGTLSASKITGEMTASQLPNLQQIDGTLDCTKLWLGANIYLGQSASAGAWATALGYYATASGSSSTALGIQANAAYSRSTSLGYNAAVTGTDQVQLGGSGSTTYCYGSVQNRSDQRDKTDVRDCVLGLEFIKKLRPVEYVWDYREDYYERVVGDDGELDFIKHESDGSKKRSRFHAGFIAQEVKSVMDEMSVDFGGYQDHSINGGEDVKSLGYIEFIPVLAQAIQELSAKVEALEDVSA